MRHRQDRPLALIAALSLGLLLTSCEREPESAGSGDGKKDSLSITTTFYPTQYLTSRLAGSHAEVVCPVPEGEDPIFWNPAEDTIRMYQESDLIVLNGAGYEKWVERVSLPQARVVDTARSFSDRFLRFEEAVTHKHGPAGVHSHEGIDGHTWLDPMLALEQARAIRAALVERLPEAKSDIEAAWQKLEADLRSLDAGLRSLLPKEASAPPLLASHPAYNYVARRYGWQIHNLNLDPATVPTDEEIETIRGVLTGFPARFILWETEPTPAAAERLKDDLGLESVVVSPSELLGEDERKSGLDYLAIQRANIERLRPVFASA